MRICPNCNLEYEDKYLFCHQCGSKLQEIIEQSFCPYCGNRIETEGDFCPYCGNSLSDEEITDSNRLIVSAPSVSAKECSTSLSKTSETSNNANPEEEKSGSVWGTVIEIVLLFLGALFAKPFAHAMRNSQYSGPFFIFSIVVSVAVVIYFLYQVVCYFKKPK